MVSWITSWHQYYRVSVRMQHEVIVSCLCLSYQEAVRQSILYLDQRETGLKTEKEGEREIMNPEKIPCEDIYLEIVDRLNEMKRSTSYTEEEKRGIILAIAAVSNVFIHWDHIQENTKRIYGKR